MISNAFQRATKSAVCAAILVLLLPPAVHATTISLTGTLLNTDDTFTTSFTLGITSSVTLQTWGFGGGTNAQGTSIAPGGFDPLIALFAGTGGTASILTDGTGNALFSADIFPGYEGVCPPGQTDTIGGTAVCGDATLSFASLGPGTYTLLLTYAPYIPFAIDPGPPGYSELGAGYTDLTGGVFQTCVTTPNFVCSDRTNAYAVDISTRDSNATPVPEPASLVLMGIGALSLIARRRNRQSVESSDCHSSH